MSVPGFKLFQLYQLMLKLPLTIDKYSNYSSQMILFQIENLGLCIIVCCWFDPSFQIRVDVFQHKMEKP